ncbi:MAG TPA: BamA/TamA family outer membrane protein [Chitinophagaceae bacterium]|nr:BamA/TamA family outer membrane protein [Chitinophagaceae bacterium]
MPVNQKFTIRFLTCFFPCGLIICLLCFFSSEVNAQETTVRNDNLIPITDVGDFVRRILNKKVDTTKAPKKSGMTILPSIGYNPSFGFVIGAKISAIKQYGAPENTSLSSFGLEGIYSTKGVVTGQARHNVFTEANKWNFQGNWQLSKFLIADYGIGTGNKEEYQHKSDSTFLIRFTFIRLTEKVYRKIGPHLFAGGGISFDIRTNINDEQLKVLPSSPHKRYGLRNDFDSSKYSANGLLLALQYTTREHPLRSYGGIYADFSLRFNQKWLGSTKNAIQLIYDLRKYISLSKKNPEHVLAFWHWASYKLSGTVPYLELPATAYDTYGRSGRAYTMGRFKGPSYACFEGEWRFPITRDKLLSGVAFINLQTASDDLEKKIFQYWEPGGGGGLRILFNKQSRSTICMDYARGKYGSSGFFFGLNEVF